MFSEKFDRIQYPSFVPLSGLEGFSFIDYDEDTNSIDKADGILHILSPFDLNMFRYDPTMNMLAAAGMIFAWSDLTGTLIFLVFLIYVKVSQKREAQATDDANVTVSDYTILVEGLPRGTLTARYILRCNL